MIKNISNLGDAAIYCDFGDQVNKEINSRVINYFNSIRTSKIKGINNLAPSYNKLVVSFDLNITNYEKIKKEILKIEITKIKSLESKLINVPLCCEEGFELDLDRLETKKNINKKKILEIFFGNEYFCYMNGFVAGMPFMGDIDSKLQCKRLETPRVKVPKGSVGLTEQFCNIYTFESPGGWNIIGNTPLNIFDKLNPISPTLVNPGDKVKFFQISKKEYENWDKK